MTSCSVLCQSRPTVYGLKDSVSLATKDANTIYAALQDRKLMARQLESLQNELRISEAIQRQQDSTIRIYLDLVSLQTSQIEALQDELKTEKKARRKEGIFSRLSTVGIAILATLLIIR